jgi:hypothetical protein
MNIDIEQALGILGVTIVVLTALDLKAVPLIGAFDVIDRPY